MVEDAFIHLAVGQLYIPLAMLRVVLELPLVVYPVVAQLREILVVELFR